jgi:NAD(P)-dependent dehydrogenase (short-subunit alcohol dehydrogenase family)
MSSPRIWLSKSAEESMAQRSNYSPVTGTSSGLGLATTEAVLARGDIVVATLRKPEAISFLTERYPASQLHVLALDVTKHADVERGFAYVREKLGRLDVVFNNAGIGFMSQLEGAPEDASRHVFEVNFWATLDVTKESIKFFREVNEPGVGGVLLQCSSVAGLVSPPSFSIYSARYVQGFYNMVNDY